MDCVEQKRYELSFVLCFCRVLTKDECRTVVMKVAGSVIIYHRIVVVYPDCEVLLGRMA